jgi:hypothetical protein
VRRVCREVANAAVSGRAQKDRFRRWAASTTMVPVASDRDAVARSVDACMDAAEDHYTGVWETCTLLANYRAAMLELPVSVHTPGAVLFAMVEALDPEVALYPLAAERAMSTQHRLLSPSGPGGMITFGQDDSPGTCAEVLCSAESVTSNR